MLLAIAVLFIAAAAFAVSEAATYPARLKARSIRRASDYGRVRLPTRVDENLRFRERVVMPASARLASIPLKLNPRTNIDAIGVRLLAAGLAQRISPSSFLAIKGGTMVGADLLGLLLAAELRRYEQGVEGSPGRLEEVEERLEDGLHSAEKSMEDDATAQDACWLRSPILRRTEPSTARVWCLAPACGTPHAGAGHLLRIERDVGRVVGHGHALHARLPRRGAAVGRPRLRHRQRRARQGPALRRQ